MSAKVEDSDEIAELFRVLGHPVRMAILRQLGFGEQAVGEVASATGIMMSTLSQQLAILRKADVVTTRRDAKQIFYSLNAEAFARMGTAIAMLCLTPASDEATAVSLKAPPGRVGAAMFARVKPRG